MSPRWEGPNEDQLLQYVGANPFSRSQDIADAFGQMYYPIHRRLKIARGKGRVLSEKEGQAFVWVLPGTSRPAAEFNAAEEFAGREFNPAITARWITWRPDADECRGLAR